MSEARGSLRRSATGHAGGRIGRWPRRRRVPQSPAQTRRRHDRERGRGFRAINCSSTLRPESPSSSRSGRPASRWSRSLKAPGRDSYPGHADDWTHIATSRNLRGQAASLRTPSTKPQPRRTSQFGTDRTAARGRRAHEAEARPGRPDRRCTRSASLVPTRRQTEGRDRHPGLS
jgi:hypothetical protein